MIIKESRDDVIYSILNNIYNIFFNLIKTLLILLRIL